MHRMLYNLIAIFLFVNKNNTKVIFLIILIFQLFSLSYFFIYLLYKKENMSYTYIWTNLMNNYIIKYIFTYIFYNESLSLYNESFEYVCIWDIEIERSYKLERIQLVGKNNENVRSPQVEVKRTKGKWYRISRKWRNTHSSKLI